MKRGTLNRNVLPEECPWLTESIPQGTVVFEKSDMYGVADENGVLVAEGDDEQPGRQVPFDAVTWDDGLPSKKEQRGIRRFRRTPIASAVEIAQKQAEVGTFDTSVLLPGAKLAVDTENSKYILEFINPKTGHVKIKGGKRWTDFADATLVGSTWGGSMLWSQQLGIGMCMEINVDDKKRITSPVTSIKVASE